MSICHKNCAHWKYRIVTVTVPVFPKGLTYTRICHTPLYQGYGNQTAQAILAEQQRKDQERAGNAALLTAGLGLVGTVAGGPVGGAIGTGIGTYLGS